MHLFMAMMFSALQIAYLSFGYQMYSDPPVLEKIRNPHTYTEPTDAL